MKKKKPVRISERRRATLFHCSLADNSLFPGLSLNRATQMCVIPRIKWLVKNGYVRIVHGRAIATVRGRRALENTR